MKELAKAAQFDMKEISQARHFGFWVQEIIIAETLAVPYVSGAAPTSISVSVHTKTHLEFDVAQKIVNHLEARGYVFAGLTLSPPVLRFKKESK